MISAKDAIRVGRALLGTPYAELDCINYLKRIIRTAPGGVPGYTTAGTNSLWASYDSAAKYRDLTWRQEGVQGARAGMLAFKRSGADVHHVGLVTGEGTVLHSSSALGGVVETDLYNGQWALLAIHRYIATDDQADTGEGDKSMEALYRATVTTQQDPLRVRSYPASGEILGHVPKGRTVDVLDTEFDPLWPKIRYGELVGYASGTYLRRIDDGGQSPEASPLPPNDGSDSEASLPEAEGETVTLTLADAQAIYEALSEAQRVLSGILDVD